MNRTQAIELIRNTFEAPFERGRYIRFLRELLNGFDDDGARVNAGAYIPDKFQEYVEKLERVGKYVSGKNEILLFIVYLKKETSIERARAMQRNFVAHYLAQGGKDAALVAFVSKDPADWRFSLVKMEYRLEEREGKPKVREEFTPARRWSFLVGSSEKSHTAQSRFVPLLEDDRNSPTLAQLEEAFNIETVTKEFFETFRAIFQQAEESLAPPWSAEQKRLYTQRFFNRLLFIAFLERKGWLKFGGRSDYLRALFADYYEKRREKNANFHRSRLNALFFMGLNYPGGDKRADPAYQPILSLIGEVPYLNGGLFEQEEDDRDGPTFPDAVIAKILTDLVYQFNFTVNEATPLDVEVAVDPEMLGRIFEELVTGRHESGSYYTPKPVVQFMCRQALKGYLQTALPAESPDSLARFVEHNDAAGLKNPEAALNALRQVKACDPACGSGAYLLGMLHELLELRECLFAARNLDARTVYERKLEIIQNNLYGVDKDPFAVNIARLRLWLSLIVDYEGATPPPLPNLDFKIETGDALTAPDPSGGLQPDMFRDHQVREFVRLKNEFMSVHAGLEEKDKLKRQIAALKQQIAEQAHPRTAKFISPDDSFDWQVEFAEVFAPELAQSTLSGRMTGIVNAAGGQMELTPAPKEGGFDIVLANPPYVRADAQFKHIEDETERQRQIAAWQAYRKRLKDSKIYNTLHEKWDLYIPFLERAYQLLRQNGQMVFIIPDAYNFANYAKKSQEFFVSNTHVRRIDFCSEIPLFSAGVRNTILHFERKEEPTRESVSILVRRFGEKSDDFEKNLEIFATFPQFDAKERIFRPRESINQNHHFKQSFIPLGKICYISTGLRPWRSSSLKNEPDFVTYDLIQDFQDDKHPKTWIESKDIVKWSFKRKRFLEWGTKRAPTQFESQTFAEFYNAPEKFLTKDISSEKIEVAYDDNQCLPSHTAYCGVPWHYLKGTINQSINKTTKYRHQDPLGDREQREEISKKFNLKYVLAIMNSSFAREWLKGRRRSKMHIYPDDWKQLPIAPISLAEQQPFVQLVDKILGEYKQHGYPLPEESARKVRAWEAELDEMVAQLYE